MNAAALTSNPFALMVQPDQVLRAMQTSKSLSKLTLQQFRPLDREEELAASVSSSGRINRAPIEFVPTIFEMDLVLPSRPVRSTLPSHVDRLSLMN